MTEYITPADAAYFGIIDAINQYGDEHSDRTGVGTKRIFGAMFKFDLMESFPIITCKRASFKNTLRELLYFLGGDPHLDRLKELGGSVYKWWEPFVKEDGTIGPLYPTQWRNLSVDLSTRQAIPVLKKSFISKPSTFKKPFLKPSVDNKIYSSKDYGDFIITNKVSLSEKDTHKYDIQFVNTHYEILGISLSELKGGNLKDVYKPNVCNVGFIGEYEISSDLDRNLYNVWRDMLARCYDTSNKSYKNYGAQGVKVCQSWFNFSQFRKDCSFIKGWINKKLSPSDFVLDKDYYGSTGYSKDTCVWLCKRDNIKYSIRNKPFKAVNKNTGEIFIDISQKEFSEKFDIDVNTISDCLNNVNTNHNIYTFNYINYDEDKYVYRYPLPIDQIQDCIDLIKNDPGSRRICFTGWNPQHLYLQNLYACHSNFVQFTVSSDNRLHMSVTQRSMDAGLGCPANWMSYSLLLVMICLVTGYTPGVFTHFVNDLHIYNNHLEALLNMERKSYSQPQLEVNDTEIKSINDFKMDDFKLLNYKSGPLIKLEMAI